VTASLPSPSTDRMRDLNMRDLSHRVRSAGGRQTEGDCGDCGVSGRGSQREVAVAGGKLGPPHGREREAVERDRKGGH
jgi:hypothetical protein